MKPYTCADCGYYSFDEFEFILLPESPPLYLCWCGEDFASGEAACGERKRQDYLAHKV